MITPPALALRAFGICALSVSLLAQLGCQSPPSRGADAPHQQRGMRIEPSGYATILSAPPSTHAAARPRPRPVLNIAAMTPDADAQHLAHELDRDIKRDEGDNYVGMKIVRDPKPRYAFQLRRSGAD